MIFGGVEGLRNNELRTHMRITIKLFLLASDNRGDFYCAENHYCGNIAKRYNLGIHETKAPFRLVI